MTEHFGGWLTNLSKYIADLNTELVKTKAENAKLLRELDMTKRMYAKVSEEKCVADSENARLREILKSLMMGTNAELCAGRDESDCKECSMHRGEDGCTVVNAMELLGIDMYGEPLGIEVDE